MGVKSFVKNAVVKGFNVKKWVDYDHLKDSTRNLGALVEGVYKQKKKAPPRKETFEQAVDRLKLSEDDIKQRMRAAWTVAVACLLGMVPVFLYALYLFHTGAILSGLVALMMCCLLGSYAFSEHFNYFQMKQRRLGCTLKEWFFSLWKV